MPKSGNLPSDLLPVHRYEGEPPPIGNATADHGAIVRRVREERHARGLTLQQVASRISISTARLSAIEQNKQTLGVDLLLALAQALEVPLERLLPGHHAGQLCVVRRAEADSQRYQMMKIVSRITGAAAGYHNRLRPLADAFVGKRMQPLDIEIHPVSDDRLQFISHHHEEFFFVLRGQLECVLKTPEGLRRETLRVGDSMYFWSYLPHCIRSTVSGSSRSLHLLYSRDDVAESELFGSDTGCIYLLDAVHKSLSDRVAAQMVALRRTHALSISQFARLLGTSPRRLSGIESGQKPVSMQFLLNVCYRCGKPVEHFLAGSVAPRPYYEVHRADARAAAVPGSAARRWSCARAVKVAPLITTMREQGMRPALVRLGDSGSSRRLVHHAGQEFLFVLSGTVQVTMRQGEGRRVETLGPGDACFLDASAPHAFEQVRLKTYDEEPAEALVVSSATGGQARVR